jgi:hypothetical protein
MKGNIFTLALVILLLTPNLFGQAKNAGPIVEEYKLWSKNWCYKESELVYVIHNETVNLTDQSIRSGIDMRSSFVKKIQKYFAEQRLKGTVEILIDDFKTKNEKSYSLEREFCGGKNYILMNDSDFDSVFRQPNKDPMKKWVDFRKKYSASSYFWRFSRVGFNPDMTQAIAYTESHCNFLCATGTLHFLIKTLEEGWVEVLSEDLWYS